MASKDDKVPIWKVNKRKYVNAYNKKNMKDIILHLNKITDDDIIKFLDVVPNKNGYIKHLIREDMQKFDGYVSET